MLVLSRSVGPIKIAAGLTDVDRLGTGALGHACVAFGDAGGVSSARASVLPLVGSRCFGGAAGAFFTLGERGGSSEGGGNGGGLNFGIISMGDFAGGAAVSLGAGQLLVAALWQFF